MKTFVRWLWFALMGLAAEGFADEGEFIVHVVNGVATVTAKLAPNTVAYGWNGTRVTYIPAFESTRMFWDAPKSQDHEFEYMPWGLIDLTVKISGKDDFLFQIDFRDINWSTNQESYPGADTYLYIDAAAYTFKLKYHYDDSTIVLSQHGYQIWTLWGKERDDGEFGTPVLLRNQFEDESHAGGTLSLYGINIPSNDYGVTEKGATVADIGTNNERFQVSNEQRKHLNWNGDHPDHLLTGSVGVPQYPFSEIAIFRPLRPAVIATQLVEGGGGDTIMFHDPWFLEADGSQPDTFLPFGSPYSPTGARNQQTGGVFLGRDYNIPGRPYYSVGAPVSQTVGGVESSFLHWSAVSAGLRSPDKDTSAVVFNEAGATVTALYKGHLRSSISSATASNSQRKIGFIDGKYHIVYESAGDIWYGYSTDNGQTWTGEFLVSDGTGHSRQPSLAVSWSSSGPHVAIVWEWFDGESYIIHLRGRYVDGSWSAPNPIWGGFCDPDYDGATPVIAMEDDFQVVAWRVKRSDEWEIPGIHVWINNGNDPVLVAGTGLNSVHPSVAVPACGQSKGRFGLVWSQSGEIYYRPFWYDLEEERLHSYSTELASEGSSLIELDYPSLVFISSNGWYPSVAWQGVHHVTYISSVQVRRKTISGWGTIQQYSLSGGDEIFHPSLTRHESPDTSLAMAMEGGGEMYLAKCTSSWGSRIDLSSGTYPSLGLDASGNNTNFRILYTDPSTSPATIASTNESLPKLSASGSEILMRELTGVKNSVLRSVIVRNLSIKDEHSESTILFSSTTDIHTISSHLEAEEYLTSEPFTIAAGQSVELTVQSSVQKKAKAAVPSATQIELLVRDASTGATLLGAVLDSLSGADSSVSVRCYTLPGGGLAGKTLRLSVFPVDGDTASGEWTATIIHCDTTGVKMNGSPEVLLRPAGAAPPEQFRLYEAYPNPFNPATTLTYDLPSGGRVLLQVYNMLGQQVAELVKEYRQAGSHTVTWNASGQASGTYLAQFRLLDAMGNSKIKQVVKLILVK